MNPNSDYYLSFNIGYPNAYDQSLGRTGANLMVHGACSSAGCYSMTDESAGEIFALARDAFKGGQRQFQIQAFPFRMTPENIARHRGDPNMDFWMNLKVGYDHFEVTRQAPTVEVCNKTYLFDADAGGKNFNASAACPTYVVPEWIATAVAEKTASDNAKIASLSGKLERDANQLASQQQKVAEQLAAEQQAAAEDAARKPLLGRVFGGKKGDPDPAPIPDTATAAAEPAPTAQPAPKAAAAPAPAPVATTEPNAVDSTTTATAVPQPAPARKLNSDFAWPEDEVAAGGSKFLPSGLDVPPPTAN
jgi:hypothetical protein